MTHRANDKINKILDLSPVKIVMKKLQVKRIRIKMKISNQLQNNLIEFHSVCQGSVAHQTIY
jgi:hypothetical protein